MTEDSTSRIYRRRYGKPTGMLFPYSHIDRKHERPMSWVPTNDFLKTYSTDTLMNNAEISNSLKAVSKSPAHSSHSEMSQTPGGKLAQEIQDELLICKICLGNYKQPKSLSCLHTFCAECLENHIQGEVTYKKYSDYREFTCPLCRKRTTLPMGGVRKLPDNFVVASLFEMIQKRKVSIAELTDDESGTNFLCQICHKMGNRKREAQTKCIDCSKLLCRSCTDIHRQTKVTQMHSLFDLNIEDDVICKVHPEESVRFFCKPCQSCICVLCTFNEHSDHEVTQFTEAVIKYKADMESQLISCQSIISEYEEKISRIKNVEMIIKSTESQISDLAAKLIAEIKQKEKLLLEEVRNVYGVSMIEVIDSKPAMENQLMDLKNTCNMTEMILQRKDIELLLLKKEIQMKLSEAQNLPKTDLPLTVSKEVKFVAGIFDFGSLQDMDRPMLTKPKFFRNYADSYNLQEEPKPEQKCIETQTDLEITKTPTVSKSVSTIPIQIANKAVNTRTRVIQQQRSLKSSSGLLSNGSSNFIEVKPISSSEGKMVYVNSDKIILSPTSRRRSSASEKMRICDTKELILTASEILNDLISNSNLEVDDLPTKVD